MPHSLALSTETERPALAEVALRLVPMVRAMTLAALALALASVVALILGLAMPALATGAAAATLGVLALGAGALGRADRHRTQSHLVLILAPLADDPDPVLITDGRLALRGANAAAGTSGGVYDRLSGWSVDPRPLTLAMLAEVQRQGRAQREFWRPDGGVRVTAHRHDGLVIWRFGSLARGGVRAVEALGLPVITLGGGAPQVNSAARALFDGAEAALAQLLEGFEGPARRGDPVALPGGHSAQPHVLPARDGLTDILLLPHSAGPDLTASGHGLDFEEIPVALAQLDSDGCVVGTNRLARALLGLAAGEARFFWEVVEGLGRPVSDWLDDARAGRALGRPEVLRATLTGQETFVQIILRRAAGPGPQGALVAVISDATELKSLEARFVQSQKMQAIGQLAGGIAHDFNNLLTAISGHCDLLLLNRDRFDPDYNDLLQIHQNANRAAALVRQLLAFSRKQTLKAETFLLESLLEDLTHLLTRLVGERITLALAHDPALGPIRADRRQLEQVIMNLVVNARDAMPMGGTIHIVTEALHLEAEREYGRARIPAGDYALVRVIDQGVGIAADIIDKIFEPFFTTKRVGEGTGLGLSTAYGIVKQMGGYIFADSVEGAGTTFSLYFAAQPLREGGAGDGISAPASTRPAPPASRADPPVQMRDDTAPRQIVGPDSPSPAGESGSPAGPTDIAADANPSVGPRRAAPPPPAAPLPDPVRGGIVLLVEDEAPVRAFAARALRLQGYQVYEAQDGEQALEFLEDHTLRVDLFVTDVIMPGIDGPGWVARALLTRPGTPVVFVSGYTEDTLSAALSRIPKAVFLGKPFSLRELSETIAQQLTA